jgi:hypothetical protein
MLILILNRNPELGESHSIFTRLEDESRIARINKLHINNESQFHAGSEYV